MNNEIKEILDIEKYRDKDGYIEDINLLPSEIHKLSNYITNLQEENERLKENAEHNDKVVDKAKWNEMIYKSRNDKSIEYIENNFISYEDSRTFGQLGEEIEIQVKEIRDLLKILKGSEKE